MESAKLSKNEIIDLIFYGLKENNVDVKDINRSEIESIFADYIMFCNHFQVAYIRGELDTFKRAACLLVAINRGRLSKDKRINASIALEAAYKMCEKPFWNAGDNFDVPQKLEEVNLKKAFENNMSTYNKTKEMLIDSLVYDKGDPISYEINLQLIYHIALESIQNPIQINTQESILLKNQ